MFCLLGFLLPVADASAGVIDNRIYTLSDIDADASWTKTGAGGIVLATSSITDDFQTYHDFPIGGAADGDKAWCIEAVVSSNDGVVTGEEAGARLFARINSDDLGITTTYREIQVRFIKGPTGAQNYVGLYDWQNNPLPSATIIADWNQNVPAKLRVRLMRQNDQIILGVEVSSVFDDDASSQSVSVALADFPSRPGITEAKQLGFGNLRASGNQESFWDGIHVTIADDKTTVLPYWPTEPPAPALTLTTADPPHEVTLQADLVPGAYLVNDFASLILNTVSGDIINSPIPDPGAAPAQHSWIFTGLEGGQTVTGGVEITEVSGRTSTGPGAALDIPGTASASGSGGDGCFIATAAYGSYLDPHVMALREFRDRHLLTSRVGRLLVHVYYKVSPPMADYIARHEGLRALARFSLTPIVFSVQHPLPAFLVFACFVGALVLVCRRRRARLI